ncbi:MAG: DUF3566 domain-containing protein [Ilumatobacter sp.]
MSKTERALSSDDGVDALDEMFTDEQFDNAFDEAIEHADLDLDMDELDALDEVEVDEVEVDEVDGDALEADELAVDADLVEDASVDEDEDPDLDTDDDVDVDVDAELDADDDLDEDDEYVLPEIIAATPEPDPTPSSLRPPLPHPTGDPVTDDVSEEIIEELRRADIDGPVVPYAPQDDTTAAVRRPRRSADYDPAPVPIPAKVPRVLGRKPRVRKVTRVVRHVDPWSVFKIALVAHMVLYVIVLTASVLLWNVANATGTVDNVERFFESFGWNSFEFNGGELYNAGWIAGLFVVIGMTGLAVLAATLFNLITDLVGGVRFTVLEEEVIETRTSPMRRFVVRRPEPDVPAMLHDSSGSMLREAVVDDTGANVRPTR